MNLRVLGISVLGLSLCASAMAAEVFDLKNMDQFDQISKAHAYINQARYQVEFKKGGVCHSLDLSKALLENAILNAPQVSPLAVNDVEKEMFRPTLTGKVQWRDQESRVEFSKGTLELRDSLVQLTEKCRVWANRTPSPYTIELNAAIDKNFKVFLNRANEQSDKLVDTTLQNLREKKLASQMKADPRVSESKVKTSRSTSNRIKACPDCASASTAENAR